MLKRVKNILLDWERLEDLAVQWVFPHLIHKTLVLMICILIFLTIKLSLLNPMEISYFLILFKTSIQMMLNWQTCLDLFLLASKPKLLEAIQLILVEAKLEKLLILKIQLLWANHLKMFIFNLLISTLSLPNPTEVSSFLILF